MLTYDPLSGSALSDSGKLTNAELFKDTASGEFHWRGVTPVEFISGSNSIFGYTGDGEFTWTGGALNVKQLRSKGHGLPNPSVDYRYRGGVLASNATRFTGETTVEFFTEHDYDQARQLTSSSVSNTLDSVDFVRKQPATMSMKSTMTDVYFFDQMKYLREQDDVVIGFMALREPKNIREDDEEVLMMLECLT